MTKALSDMNSNLNRINAPNMKAMEKWVYMFTLIFHEDGNAYRENTIEIILILSGHSYTEKEVENKKKLYLILNHSCWYEC